MEIRLHPEKGGDGTIHRIAVVHDTGSTVMCILDTDLAQLGSLRTFTGTLGDKSVVNASGVHETFPRIWLQVHLLNDDHQAIMQSWVSEIAIIRPAGPGVPRLSGSLIRNTFLFATPLGNRFTAVSTSKTGLNSLL